MYTSDKNEIIHYADNMLHDAFLSLIAGIACAAFGLIYELFSHEVYSFYMIYAFLIPLLPGTLLNLVIVWLAVKKEKQLRIREAAARSTVNAAFADVRNNGDAAVQRVVDDKFQEDADARYELSNEPKTPVNTGVFFPGPADSQNCVRNEIAESNAGTGVFFPGRFTRHAWNSGLAALTAGSLFKGVLDIYGTTNKLIVVYPIAAAVLLFAAAASFSMSYAAARRMRRKAEMTAA